MDKLKTLILIVISLLSSALSLKITGHELVYDIETANVTFVDVFDYSERQEPTSDGILIGSQHDIFGYYNNDHYDENKMEVKHTGISDPLIHFDNELLLYEDSTFVSIIYTNNRRSMFIRTGRWTVRNRTVELYSKIPLIKNKDFVDSHFMMMLNTAFVEDTIAYDIVSPDIPITDDYNKPILIRYLNKKRYIPGDLRWNEYNDQIALLQNAIANDDTAGFIKLYKTNGISQYKSRYLNMLLVRYAIAQRSTNILMFMKENGFFRPRDIDEHPYKYALRRILYPSKYDIEPKRMSNIERRNALVLEITKYWNKDTISDETDKALRIRLDRSFGQRSDSQLLANWFQLLIW